MTLAFGHIILAGSALLLRPLRGWSVLFPAFRAPVTIDFYSIATLAFLVIAPYLAATILPSWKAAVTDPDLVMRN
jgi:ABC-type lipoprotein release transport system permease subunit